MLTLSQVNDTILKALGDSKSQAGETVYELSEDKSYYKLIVSMHNLSYQDVLVIHTKFMFKANLEKTGLIEDSCFYLYDINCEYKKLEFTEDDETSLYEGIYSTILYRKFGADILTLSDFQLSATKMNNYLYTKKIKDISIYDITYQPKQAITPCADIDFSFDIRINNDITVNMILKKTETKYNVTLKYLNEYKDFNYDSIVNLPEMMTQELINLL